MVRPNIVVILADDLGYADISSYGGTRIATPNIDRIAKGGVAFTDAYSAAPVCSPSRAGLNTGIRDADNLTWKLVMALRGRAGASLLETYEAERRPYAEAIIRLSVRLGTVMMPTSRM